MRQYALDGPINSQASATNTVDDDHSSLLCNQFENCLQFELDLSDDDNDANVDYGHDADAYHLMATLNEQKPITRSNNVLANQFKKESHSKVHHQLCKLNNAAADYKLPMISQCDLYNHGDGAYSNWVDTHCSRPLNATRYDCDDEELVSNGSMRVFM